MAKFIPNTDPKRTEQINIRVSPAELARLRVLAAELEMTCSDVVRILVNKEYLLLEEPGGANG